MDTVDITPTPEACRQIARLFTAQRADAEALAARAAQALAHLDEHPDGHLAPWGRGAATCSPSPSRPCTRPRAPASPRCGRAWRH